MPNKTIKDSFFSMKVINKLLQEELEAVDSYKKAIASCEDETCLEVFNHILKEELEHIKELTKLKVSIKDCKSAIRDSGIKYIVIVNGERYATFNNYDDAISCENSFYNMDPDAESYYGSYPDVRIIKEDAYGRRIKDTKRSLRRR